jgi:hypothetical protein
MNPPRIPIPLFPVPLFPSFAPQADTTRDKSGSDIESDFPPIKIFQEPTGKSSRRPTRPSPTKFNRRHSPFRRRPTLYPRSSPSPTQEPPPPQQMCMRLGRERPHSHGPLGLGHKNLLNIMPVTRNSGVSLSFYFLLPSRIYYSSSNENLVRTSFPSQSPRH